ncbi:hypothetical protein BU24DRAFT_428237 [Aaosphaeria arxii CBS 175.79]|uniref:Uncharacterized protein n=1 Tax=Aaosphaeria arxii CBS 175.79 TaxID=1450172 RepID=A0A6A5XBD5_9PLEO|nr:uncharacterized protein BU24DRAFT_428237 [Aaosphaeria arxii CBS 175.79]KAF2010230.1 hypothetical protein BU24DRAFT_428237 [Aaosphaeria arxii CBS 175.79]
MRCFRAKDFRKDPNSGSASDPDYFMDALIMDCGCGAETVRMIENYLLVCKWCGGSIRRPRED